MDEFGLLTAIPTGITAFLATNLDDILILLLFFTQTDLSFRRRQIVAGQYLGFLALIIISLPGFLGGLLLPRPWIGLLGLVPILIGLNRLLVGNGDESDENSEAVITSALNPADNSNNLNNLKLKIPLGGIFTAQTYSVAAITFANGGDNVGIYLPLFANSSWQSLTIILGIFFLLVGLWCYVAYQLTKVKIMADYITRYGDVIIPFVLIILGALIIFDSHTLDHQSLVVLILITIAVYLANFSSPHLSC
ncbi:MULTISPECIES: cadmium resistance transporter [unclassified Synechocystis]|uniref:cadmium resistance transporter n=1 Tax=unclassified Synechocystis TaxID=2640012 RepID=UPI0004101C3F|nr:MULTISPECIES: cadmium resistance transporter [unclassified Synechocystis]AIE75669.1 Cadmium resistance transporter [Synechocystis sp. PCC 6714]MCT0253856.1 cadmium resistance transporter [Synechocystis sp. CS-94]